MYYNFVVEFVYKQNTHTYTYNKFEYVHITKKITLKYLFYINYELIFKYFKFVLISLKKLNDNISHILKTLHTRIQKTIFESKLSTVQIRNLGIP